MSTQSAHVSPDDLLAFMLILSQGNCTQFTSLKEEGPDGKFHWKITTPIQPLPVDPPIPYEETVA